MSFQEVSVCFQEISGDLWGFIRHSREPLVSGACKGDSVALQGGPAKSLHRVLFSCVSFSGEFFERFGGFQEASVGYQ